MRYVIIGAGAVGGTVGGYLAKAGKDVVLVARGAHLEALRSTGLRLATPKNSYTFHLPAIGGPEELDLKPGDVLVLAMKSQHTVAALDAWANRPVRGGDSGDSGDSNSGSDGGEPKTAAEVLPVVCVQNGVANEREALRRFGHVYAVSVLLPAGHVEPGLVTAVSEPTPGVLPIGRYPEGVDATAGAIAADLTAAGFAARPEPHVMRYKYAKLLRNLMNAVEALAGPDAHGEAGRQLHARATEEARTVFRAAGIETVTPEEEDAERRRHITFGEVPDAPRGGGSSWQSLTRGTGSIETDFLNGEIALLGRLHGVPTPVNAGLQRLASRAAAEGRRPGELTSSTILDLVK